VFARLLLLFTVVPLVELVLLLWLGYQTHWTWAIATVLLTGLAGAWLMRHQGLRAWRRVHDDLAAGRMPAESLQDAALILVAGVLLLTPGVLTDLAAVLLLVPLTRRWAKAGLARWFGARFRIAAWPSAESGPGTNQARDQVIDVRAVDPAASAAGPPRRGAGHDAL
jgi:UPF0716 protein FxsA